MRSSCWRRSGMAAIAGWLLASWLVAANADEPASVVDVGRGMYEQYCSACHGDDGRGHGDFAELLRAPPPDLTELAKRHGGRYPELEIAEVIDGRRALRAHGDPEMPIWGERFAEQASRAQGSETALRGRVMVLVEYLRSIQRGAPAALSPPLVGDEVSVSEVGRRLYIRNCSACHGILGKGNGYLGVLLRTPPRDLTRIAHRRGGSFPAAEVAEAIDGRREVRAHGPREMPVWGDRFRIQFPPNVGRERAVQGEIMLVVEYLRSLQKPVDPSSARENVPMAD